MLMTVTIAAFVLGLLLALTSFLSLRKRFANRDLRLIGEAARVETTLRPDGTVIIGGELWPARSIDGLVIASRRRVRVVSVDDLSLLVEVCDLHSRSTRSSCGVCFNLIPLTFHKKLFTGTRSALEQTGMHGRPK